LGAVILSLLPTITKQLLNANEQVITLFLAIFTIGIAIGAIACEKLSYKRVEIGLVPFGSLGMTFFLTDMAFVLAGWVPSVGTADLHSYFNTAGSLRLGIDLLGIAFLGGIFTVPLYTLIQQRSRPEVRSRVIGANNIMNALFMVIGSALLVWFLQMKMSIPTILLAYAGFNLIVAVYIYTLVPEFTMRFLAWILAHCFYRLRVTNEERIPEDGAALLVCNHVSFIDWMIIAAGVRRPLRFVMYYKFAQLPLLRYLLKQAGAIPIAGKNEDPVIFEQAFVRIHKCLQEGELVCIFPEGALTKDGELQEFRKGVEHIIAKVPVPVVPMALNGLWGSICSHKGSKALTRLPQKIWFPVHLVIDHAVPATEVTAAHLEMRVRQMLT
jgi:1-acyl-sn-glycerol-3-phosphate acyltransferase